MDTEQKNDNERLTKEGYVYEKFCKECNKNQNCKRISHSGSSSLNVYKYECPEEHKFYESIRVKTA